MDSDPLTRLKNKLDSMRRERDSLNGVILQERARNSQLEAELARLRNEFLRSKAELDEKEATLQRFNETIRESENAYAKLLTNTDKLLTALEHESSNLSRKFKQ
ncbi:unnamed protein product [Blepharisma stoltei]|uniref:Uncharacterized protein n=1 Tax=Blepharisma stoltei TaxID=1481888 RepID=A0AAU9IAM4_9CILI|nr:unnamed protein product [Blepharisma stoltei]